MLVFLERSWSALPEKGLTAAATTPVAVIVTIVAIVAGITHHSQLTCVPSYFCSGVASTLFGW